MADLRAQEGLSILDMTHDIVSARYVADRILVMDAGHVVESGTAEPLLARPKHPYTQLLFSAAPDAREPVSVSTSAAFGEPPRVVNPAEGSASVRAARSPSPSTTGPRPRLRVLDPGHEAACHVAVPGPALEADAPLG